MKQRLCPDCLLPNYECLCDGADHFENNAIRRKLRSYGIDDPKAFIKSCLAHHTGHLKRSDTSHPTLFSQR